MANANYNNVKSDVEKTAASVGEIKDRALNAASDAKDDLRDVANQAGRRLRSAISHAKDDFDDASETLVSTIRARPLQAAMVAGAAGFLLAMLTRR